MDSTNTNDNNTNENVIVDGDERLNRIKAIGEEITTISELNGCLNVYHSPHPNKRPICYDGFEPSGRIHIAQGLMKAWYIKTMVDCGCDVVIWIADLFAMLNNKFGGDMNKIKVCGEYMIEVWTVYLKLLKVDMKHVKFLWASEEINKDPNRYWNIVMHITRHFNIARFKKCTPILGRNDVEKQTEILKSQAVELEMQENYKEANKIYKQIIALEDQVSMPLSYLMYAAMQCADIYFLEADICQLGVDQKKVNMLAREYADIISKHPPSFIKVRIPPIIVSHHMLLGLQHKLKEDGTIEQTKMSKSDPESAIFMDDSEVDVNRKIKKAFCRPKDTELNPMLEYTRYIILPWNNQITIQKPEKFGGNTFTFNNTPKDIQKLYEMYQKDIIHPSDLKPIVRDNINRLLQPMREHFQNDKHAKQILNTIKKWKK